MNAKEKYNSLNVKSAWAYTKQIAEFSELFLSSKLFSEISDVEGTNVEQYFNDNYERYGISTNRHRILAIAQMFGLLTKEPYYSRGGSSYSNETVTPVFNELKKYAVDSVEFKKIMSEQLLKVKIKSIIDTTDNRDDYYVYPFLFLFLVMWKLDKDYAMKLVPMNKIWTYVLTCRSMDEVDDAARWVADPKAKISPFVSQYKSDSRIMTLIFNNTKMFSLEHDLLSLNHPIADEFYDNFVLVQNLTKLQTYLSNDVKYKHFLENIQGFDFDLTDNPTGTIRRTHRRAVFRKNSEFSGSASKDISIVVPDKDNPDIDTIIDILLDMEDEQEVKDASVYNSEEDIDRSNNREPVLKSGLETNNRFSTDPRLAKTAIKNAGFVCELVSHIDGSHVTFDSIHGTKYLEAHHLVPMKAQKDFVSLGINLDRLDNIVALCPNCHKAVHYGTRAEKIKYLRPLYETRIGKLNEIGIDIDFDVLINDYYK